MCLLVPGADIIVLSSVQGLSRDKSSHVQNSLWIYDIDKNKWSVIRVAKHSEFTALHVAAIYNFLKLYFLMSLLFCVFISMLRFQ